MSSLYSPHFLFCFYLIFNTQSTASPAPTMHPYNSNPTALITAAADNVVTVSVSYDGGKTFEQIGYSATWTEASTSTINATRDTIIRADAEDIGHTGGFIATISFDEHTYSTTEPLMNSNWKLISAASGTTDLEYFTRDWTQKTGSFAQDAVWVWNGVNGDNIRFEFDFANIIQTAPPTSSPTFPTLPPTPYPTKHHRNHNPTALINVAGDNAITVSVSHDYGQTFVQIGYSSTWYNAVSTSIWGVTNETIIRAEADDYVHTGGFIASVTFDGHTYSTMNPMKNSNWKVTWALSGNTDMSVYELQTTSRRNKGSLHGLFADEAVWVWNGKNSDDIRFEFDFSNLIDPTTFLTGDPTQMPTPLPTNDPTKIPTNYPSVDPTIIPTEIPTNAPSVDPTEIPTNDPTIIPTYDPTQDPSINPTKNPTMIHLEGHVGDHPDVSVAVTDSIPDPMKGETEGEFNSVSLENMTNIAALVCGCLLLLVMCLYCVYRRKKMKKFKENITNMAVVTKGKETAVTASEPRTNDIDMYMDEEEEGGGADVAGIECSQLKQWLHSMELDKYYAVFVKNGFDKQLMAISELNDNDLQQIGITLMADRKRILREIRLLNEANECVQTPKGIHLSVDIGNNQAMHHNAMNTPTEVEGMYDCDDDPQNETAGGANTAGGFDIIYKDDANNPSTPSDERMY